jgi:hypothetical protein
MTDFFPYDRNGRSVDGSYNPEFDYEDRTLRQFVNDQMMGQMSRGYYSGPPEHLAYQQDYRQDAVYRPQGNPDSLYMQDPYSDYADERSGYRRQMPPEMQSDMQSEMQPVQYAQYRPEGGERGNSRDGRRHSWTEGEIRDFYRLDDTVSGLNGQSINRFFPNMDPDVACAKAVSLAIKKAWGYNVDEVNVNRLEQRLRGFGFTQVSSPRDVKPGDVILAYREQGDYSHSAIYMGNDRIFNNDSKTGLMRMESITKFNEAQFKRFVILRKPSA